MEGDFSIRDWLTQSWRPKSPMVCCPRAGGPGKPVDVVPVRTPRPEDQGSQWRGSQPESTGRRTRSTMSDVPGQEKMNVPAKQRANSPFICLLVLWGPSGDWVMPTHIGEGDLLYSVYPFKC